MIDLHAEQGVLGALLLGRAAYSVLDALVDEDFHDPRHQIIVAALRSMIGRGQEPDAVTLIAELQARSKLAGPGSAGGPTYVFDLSSLAPTPSSATHYAQLVRRASRLRAAKSAAHRFADALDREDATEYLETLAGSLTDDLSRLPPDLTGEQRSTPPTIREILAQEDTMENWLIPGLIERSERIVLTGGEGVAKSTILKQIAVCLAGGLHPWTGARVSDGLRVLHIDAENSQRQTRRNYRWIGHTANHRPLMDKGWEDRIIHHTRNDGLDVVGRDRAWFLSACNEARPDAIILGPAYKMMAGDPNKDVDVLALLSVLDQVRVKHDAALLIEAHSPHASEGSRRTVRPVGSSVWLRWPEIGIGVRKDLDATDDDDPRPKHLEIVGWRGQREQRDWPDLIKFGRMGELPWVPTRPDYHPTVESSYHISDLGEAV